MENSPKIAVEIRDTGMEGETLPGMLSFYEGCTTAADMAKKAETMPALPPSACTSRARIPTARTSP